MPRLLKTALLTLVGFSGGVLSYFGIHSWFSAHRTVTTLLESLSTPQDSEALRFDNSDPWLDKDFILHRVAAALIVLLGVFLLAGAVKFMFQRDHDPAT